MDPLTGAGDIPAMGFGVYRMEPSDVLRMVPHVLLLGCRHIDTAQIYGNEAEVGEGLAASGVPRSHVFLTTKVWIANYGRDAFHSSVDESLTKLRTDYVDLLLLHWPNDQTPLADQIEALNQVRAAGKARHIGVSNFNTHAADRAAQSRRGRPTRRASQRRPLAEARRGRLAHVAHRRAPSVPAR